MEQIKQLITNSMNSLKNLSRVQKMLAAGSILAVLIGIMIAVGVQKEPAYEYVFQNLSSEDSASITEFLKKNNMTEYVVDANGIKVPTASASNYRIKVSQEGLPSQGIVGWEQFDQADFSRTEFERKTNKLRAIQGELQRTINSIEGVMSSRVHLVMPTNRLFEKDQKQTTAAVYVRTKNGYELTQKQIRGMIHLVSKSVEGLTPDSISIIDFQGKLLTEEKSSDPDAQENKEMLEYKKSVEKRLEEKVRTIVGRVVGAERVESRVDVDIDFTKEEQTISDVDPDKVVVISQNTTNQSADGAGLNPTGIPGAKSNVPGESEGSGGGSGASSKSRRDSELVNYEIAKTISKRTLPVGKIKRISAAVIVDGKQPYPVDGEEAVFEARTEEEMKKIGELARSAIGFVDGRDEVRVHNLLFQMDNVRAEKIEAGETEKREYVSTIVLSGLTALGLILFFAFIVRPYIRWLFYNPDRKKREEIVEEFLPDFESEGRQSVQVKEDIPFEKLSVQEKVLHIARHEPMRTTEALRIMLNPHA